VTDYRDRQKKKKRKRKEKEKKIEKDRNRARQDEQLAELQNYERVKYAKRR